MDDETPMGKIARLPVYEHVSLIPYHKEHPKSPIEVYVHGERLGGFPISCLDKSVLCTMDLIYKKAFKDGQENRSKEIGRLLGVKNG